MTSYEIVLLPGDGIGPEVMDKARTVLTSISELYELELKLHERACGFEYQSIHYAPWPEDTFELCRDTADSILLGAIGRSNSSEPDSVGQTTAGRTIVLGLRSKLDLFANVRPVRLFESVLHNISGDFKRVWEPNKVNMVIVRENTEGFYQSQFKEQTHTKDGFSNVIDQRTISESGSKRIKR